MEPAGNGSRISQSEYNATVMPISMRTRPFSRVAAATCTPSPRVFTHESGNVVNNAVNRNRALTQLATNVHPHARPNFLSGQPTPG